MARRKSKIRCLLITSQEGVNFLQTIINEIIKEVNIDIQVDLYFPYELGGLIDRQSDKDLLNQIHSCDLTLFDYENASVFSFFELGITRAIGKPMVLLFPNNSFFFEAFPTLISQNQVISYKSKEQLQEKLKGFFIDFTENTKKYIPKSLIESSETSQINIDFDRLDQREFENLCFELLSKLGYKQLEWQFKDEFVDALTTLRKRDPDGFEYEESWLISFNKDYSNDKLFHIALNEPEYFVERIYRYLSEPELFSSNKNNSRFERGDVPITILFVFRGKQNSSKGLLRDLLRKDRLRYRSHYPITVRIRWWDDEKIMLLLQKNQQLARKYFSPDALTNSGIRLSYEELYKQYLQKNEELETVNQALKDERNRIEILERDAAWKLLSFTAAHRLGNPLDAIDSELANLKVAIEQNREDVIKEIVTSMEIPIEKAKSIVNQFRNLSIAHEIKPEIVNSENLNALLKTSAKLAADKNVVVVFSLKKLPNILVDSLKLSECFDELIKNSLHFIKIDNPEIKISTLLSKSEDLPDNLDRYKTFVKIIFSDNGCGVPVEKKADIFKPFERSYIHGTGLGLAFCEVIIEKHGGKIREIGKQNEGAVFEIFLPVQMTK